MKLTYHLGGFILGILQLPDRGQFGNHGAGASQMLQVFIVKSVPEFSFSTYIGVCQWANHILIFASCISAILSFLAEHRSTWWWLFWANWTFFLHLRWMVPLLANEMIVPLEVNMFVVVEILIHWFLFFCFTLVFCQVQVFLGHKLCTNLCWFAFILGFCPPV